VIAEAAEIRAAESNSTGDSVRRGYLVMTLALLWLALSYPLSILMRTEIQTWIQGLQSLL